jgi:hypothetical protein
VKNVDYGTPDYLFNLFASCLHKNCKNFLRNFFILLMEKEEGNFQERKIGGKIYYKEITWKIY